MTRRLFFFCKLPFKFRDLLQVARTILGSQGNYGGIRSAQVDP